MTDTPSALDAEVMLRVRELAGTRAYVKASILGRRLPQVTQSRLYASLDRLEGAGHIERRRIADGRRTKNREYVLTSKEREG